MGEPITYELEEPIIVGEGAKQLKVESFEIRHPKAGDLRILDGQPGSVSRTLALIGKLSKQPPAVLDELSIKDMVALGKIVDDFFPDGLPTGATS